MTEFIKKITIGITDTTSSYSNYPLWIKGSDDTIDIIKLTPDNFEDLKKCNGIVLTGGIDSHPKFYNNSRLNYPNAPEQFNVMRDEFEISIFNYSQQNNIPVLAICRGMQLVNIILGGTIIQDLEENNKNDHKRKNGFDSQHEINIVKESLLYLITACEKGTVNSAHHQGLDKIADDLIVTSFSEDNVAESIEWKNKKDKSFLLGVQWHPERLLPLENPFSEKVRTAFLNTVFSNIEPY